MATKEEIRRWASHFPETEELDDGRLEELIEGKYEIHIVPHTHWDRERSFTEGQHRVRLVKLIDNLIDILESDPKNEHFVLDGQALLVEDYLSVKPHMKKRLAKLVEKGRIKVGPFYSQIDEMVTTGETQIRNLLIGHMVGEDIGAVMKVGYAPDSFGHMGQLPQLLRGFGIDSAAFFRGIDPHAENNRTNFRWKGYDGSDVMVAYMLGSYVLMTWPVTTPEMPEALVIRGLARLAPYASSNHLLFPAGNDSAEAHPALPQVIRRLKEAFPNHEVKLSSLEEYVEAVRHDQADLPVVEGELRDHEQSCLAAISSRMDLKLAYQQAAVNLERFAEPFSALARIECGREYPAGILADSWMRLLKNVSHNSITGTSMERVHDQNLCIFNEINRVAETLAIRALKTLHENVKSPDKNNALEQPITVFNPLPWVRTDAVEFYMPFRQMSGDIRNPWLERGIKSFEVTDLEGNVMPTFSVKEERTLDGGRYYRVSFVARDVPGLGYQTFIMRSKRDKQFPNYVSDSRNMENEFYELTFNDNGSFDLKDKSTDLEYKGLHLFEYRHSPGNTTEYEKPIVSGYNTRETKVKLSVIERGDLATTMKVSLRNWQVPSYRARGQSAAMDITSYVTIYKGVERIDIYTELDNKCWNHRVRAAFFTDIRADLVWADTQFGVVPTPVNKRQLVVKPPKRVDAHPHQSLIDVSDGKKGLAIFSRGLPEFEARDSRDGVAVRLTLWRATLSHHEDVRESIPEGYFSAASESEDAQGEGIHGYHYSLFPHAGDWRDHQVARRAAEFNSRMWPETLWYKDYPKWMSGPYGFENTLEFPEGELPASQAFLALDPDVLILSAFKKAERSDDYIVRVYNSGDGDEDGVLKIWKKPAEVVAVDLNEQPLEEQAGFSASAKGDSTLLKFSIGRYQIRTFRLTFELPEEKQWFHSRF